jgi:plastocyanin
MKEKSRAMTRQLVFASSLMLSLLAAILMLYPIHAKGEESKPQGSEVRIDNFTFTPGTLTIPMNSAVTWVNKDDIPHVIASNDGLFKSKALDTDQTYSFTFAKPGTYSYFCSIHPKMIGKIIVQ